MSYKARKYSSGPAVWPDVMTGFKKVIKKAL